MRRRHASNFSVDSEAFDIARGLYDSKGKLKQYKTLQSLIIERFSFECRGLTMV